ncbi:mannose-6-phosphate isomerase, partial [Bradyrhizobium sp. SHOUNA76]|nr:mannose-6-phosphate isomerase [Bradyrhizobium sp. SHOUNA76]
MADVGNIAAHEAADVVVRLKRRMIDEALPLWSTVGWDQATGGFIDRLHRDGT